MTPDGTITSLRLEHGITASGCTQVSGDGIYTGAVTSATTFNLRMTDVWRCVDPRGNPYEADRTVTVAGTRR